MSFSDFIRSKEIKTGISIYRVKEDVYADILSYMKEHLNMQVNDKYSISFSGHIHRYTALEAMTRGRPTILNMANVAAIELIKRGATITDTVMYNIKRNNNRELFKFIVQLGTQSPLPAYYPRDLVDLMKEYFDLKDNYEKLKDNYEKLEKELEILHDENDELKKETLSRVFSG